MVRGVVTLQVGHYAGFVGAHYWNIQDEYATMLDDAETRDAMPESQVRDITTSVQMLLRPRAQGGAVPRLLVYDAAGSLGSLSESGSRATSAAHAARARASVARTWDGKLVEAVCEQEAGNEFLDEIVVPEHQGPLASAAAATMAQQQRQQQQQQQQQQHVHQQQDNGVYQLESKVRVWSDYLRPVLHERTVNLVREWSHEDSSSGIPTWSSGWDLLESPTSLDASEDAVRYFVEECDSLMGFQLMCDASNGFSGLASRLGHLIRDEYANKSVLAMPVEHNGSFDDLDQRNKDRAIVNRAVMTRALHTTCDLVIPCDGAAAAAAGSATSLFGPQASLPFHSSALLAAALDTCTLSYRQALYPTDMSVFAHTLTPGGSMRFAALFAAMPLHVPAPLDFASALRRFPDRTPLHRVPALRPLGRFSHASHTPLADVVTLRGLDQDQAAAIEPPLNDLLLRDPVARREVVVMEQAVPVPMSYPNFFAAALGPRGDVRAGDPAETVPCVVQEFPMMTHVHASDALHPLLAQTLRDVTGVSSALLRGGEYSDASGVTTADAFAELCDCLISIRDAYRSVDDSDDDDHDHAGGNDSASD